MLWVRGNRCKKVAHPAEACAPPPSAVSLGDLYSFDPANMTWTLLSAAEDSVRPAARDGHGFTSAGGKLYVFGGWRDSSCECITARVHVHGWWWEWGGGLGGWVLTCTLGVQHSRQNGLGRVVFFRPRALARGDCVFVAVHGVSVLDQLVHLISPPVG